MKIKCNSNTTPTSNVRGTDSIVTSSTSGLLVLMMMRMRTMAMMMMMMMWMRMRTMTMMRTMAMMRRRVSRRRRTSNTVDVIKCLVSCNCKEKFLLWQSILIWACETWVQSFRLLRHSITYHITILYYISRM